MNYKRKENHFQLALLGILALYVLKTAVGINLSENYHAHDLLLHPDDVIQEVVDKIKS